MGDITYEECEVSWINQADMSPLLAAYPQLEVFRVRGGTGLAFSKIKHAHLTELGVETVAYHAPQFARFFNAISRP